MIESFQARLEEELQSQTQEATSSGAEVDEHVVTRKVLGERRGHEKGVGRILRGRNGSTSSTVGSRATCGPGSSSSGPTYEEFTAVQAQCAAMQAETQQYREFAAMQQQFYANLVAQLQTSMPNFQIAIPFPIFPNLNQPLNPNPNPNLNPNPAVNDNEQEEEEEEEDLGAD